jgi:hypothetical protein
MKWRVLIASLGIETIVSTAAISVSGGSQDSETECPSKAHTDQAFAR